MSRDWSTYLLYGVSVALVMGGAALGFTLQAPGVGWALIVIGLGVAAGGADAGGDAPAAPSLDRRSAGRY